MEALSFLVLLVSCFADFEHNGVFDAAAMEFAAVIVDPGEFPCGVVGICYATAGAEETGEAIVTFFVSVYAAAFEFLTHFVVVHAGENIPQAESFVTDELMAGIEVPGGSDCHIFGADTAAGNAFYDAGAAF